MKKIHTILSFIVIVVILSGCIPVITNVIGETVTISMVYGSEKEAWLEPLVTAFNEARYETESGARIEVEATPMGSIESAERIIAEALQPTIWSPRVFGLRARR